MKTHYRPLAPTCFPVLHFPFCITKETDKMSCVVISSGNVIHRKTQRGQGSSCVTEKRRSVEARLLAACVMQQQALACKRVCSYHASRPRVARGQVNDLVVLWP